MPETAREKVDSEYPQAGKDIQNGNVPFNGRVLLYPPVAPLRVEHDHCSAA